MSTARTSPEIFIGRLPIDALKVTAVSSLMSGIVLVADRWLFRPYEIVDLKTAAVATLVVGIVIMFSFVFIIVASIFFPLIIADRDGSEKYANAWAIMFCFVWFLSVTICLIDLLTKIVFDASSGPIFYVFSLIGTDRNVFGFRGDLLLPCIVYATIAYLILLTRSLIIDRLYFSLGRTILSFLVLVPFSALAMYFAIWAPLTELFSKLLSA